MASIDPWSDFELIRSTVARNTVDKLKQIILGLSDECGVHLQKTGKKQDIIDRVLAVLDNWKLQKTVDKWLKAKHILTSVSTRGVYSGNQLTAAATSLASHAMPGANYGSTSNYAQSTALPTARYDPYAPPRRPSGSIPGLPTTTLSSTLTASKPLLRFKESPFFTIDQPVSPVVECPESNSSTDRRQQTVVFTLSPDQIAKLKSVNPKYQLRLFCTSSSFYSLNPSFRSNSVPSLMEFPPTCEVRVNNVQLSANLKGLKKKPGTAPPPDLGKYIRVNNTANKVEMVYVNSQQPVLSKKFYLVAMLVKTVTIDSLVDKLKANSFTSTETVLAKMRAALNDDDDIISGPQKMSLKCPLSFMRVNTPCRSSKCVHPQCFDATSWFSMMEQTTTWLCPVCEKSLDTNDLIIDGYFDSILKQCPDSVEDVFVEADGEWHTSDSKYGSANWKILHPPTKPISLPPTPRKPPSSAKSSSQCNAKPNGKSKADPSIFILDSDDEEEDRVKQELSPSFGSSQAPSVPPSTQSDVIDLTLDSDDEDSPPPPPRQTGKRKASEPPSPTETIWKKSRGEDDRTGASSSTYPRLDPLPSLDDAFTIRYGMHSTSTVQPLHPISGAINGRYMGNGYIEPEEPWRRLRIFPMYKGPGS